MNDKAKWDAIIVGGGIAGLSAAIYLGRAERKVLIIDGGKSLAKWEPEVQNYLGFPEGVSGEELLKRGHEQAACYGASFVEGYVETVDRSDAGFVLRSESTVWETRRLLLATGLFHLGPQLEGVDECLGHSMFFCKDCDGFRVRDKRILIYGANNDAADYALAMLIYSRHVGIVTNNVEPHWTKSRAETLDRYKVPVFHQPVTQLERSGCQVLALRLKDGKRIATDAIFTTRGDVYFNKLARQLGAELDDEGQIVVDGAMRTSVPSLYAAGCVTPANCQMIIAAGQGATAAQSINRDLFEESVKSGSLPIAADD